jgi:hypothetical protein
VARLVPVPGPAAPLGPPTAPATSGALASPLVGSSHSPAAVAAAATNVRQRRLRAGSRALSGRGDSSSHYYHWDYYPIYTCQRDVYANIAAELSRMQAASANMKIALASRASTNMLRACTHHSCVQCQWCWWYCRRPSYDARSRQDLIISCSAAGTSSRHLQQPQIYYKSHCPLPH